METGNCVWCGLVTQSPCSGSGVQLKMASDINMNRNYRRVVYKNFPGTEKLSVYTICPVAEAVYTQDGDRRRHPYDS